MLSVRNRTPTTRSDGVSSSTWWGTGVLLVVSAVAMLYAECGHAGANIEDFGDALWWAMTTVTTVGYGDRFSVTGLGLSLRPWPPG
jgi:voltage-gated potassium channel